MTTIAKVRGSKLALSLTGSGHLLVYQLGVCQILWKNNNNNNNNNSNHNGMPTIEKVVGASGGAIVATLLSHMPDQMEAYAKAFVQQRGGGLQLLKDFYYSFEKENHQETIRVTSIRPPSLSIATTRCHDGASHVFDIGEKQTSSSSRLFDILQASCRIPPTFHPMDVFSSTSSIYPDQHGIPIPSHHHHHHHDDDKDDDDYSYVDGGISTPAPPTTLSPSSSSSSQQRLIISPFSGTSRHSLRISPDDTTPKLSSWRQQKMLPVDLGVYYSIQNARAIPVAMGIVSASSKVLESWYQLGQDDAHRFLCQYNNINHNETLSNK